MDLKLLQKNNSKNSRSRYKIADQITRASKTSSKNNSGTNEEEILKGKYISSELRHKITDDLRLKEEN